jgi:hypothetical protein
MTIGYDKPLYVLHFDHRATFLKKCSVGRDRQKGLTFSLVSVEVAGTSLGSFLERRLPKGLVAGPV